MHTYFTIVIHAQLRTYGSRFGLITFIVGWQNHKACLSDFDFLKEGTSLRSFWMYVSSPSTKLVQFQLGKSTTFLIGRSNEVMSEEMGASLELQMLNPTKIQIQWHSLPEIYGKKILCYVKFWLDTETKKGQRMNLNQRVEKKDHTSVQGSLHWNALLTAVFNKCCFSCKNDNDNF